MPIHQNSIVPPKDPNSLVIEMVDYTNGIKVYVQGHKIPFKGMPTKEAVDAIAIIKKLLKFQPIKAMWAAMEPHILKEQFQQPITKEIIKMFPSKLGQIIAHTFEYDSSYRLRMQDLFSETSKEKLLNNPFSEIRKLIAINKRRDHIVAHGVMRYTLLIIMFILFIPWFRRKLTKCHFPNLQLDSDDRYWLDLRTDYNSKA